MTDPQLQTQLDRARKELLDLTGRNRLLNTPRRKSRGKALEIVDELSDEIFRILFAGGKRMAFLAAAEPEEPVEPELAAETDALGQPEEDEDLDERGVAARHADTRLQTSLDDVKLQKKLLSLFYDARTAEEEQGVNILYLALGFLEWYEVDHSDRPRYAPLILLPCELTRRAAGGRIHLEARDEEIHTNLSLQARLHADFGIELPELPDADELTPSDYFSAVEQSVDGRDRWRVHRDDMVLSFFSFSKFLMYRDLDARNWPADAGLHDNAVLRRLLGDGFEPLEPLWPADDRIDAHVAPADMVHVMDADSSQIEAIEEVKAGRNLVIHGPPGTGKSQTITNIIAAAVMQDKTVLFVAEKLAALEVVRERLDQVGLGRLCLELHSRKANKKAVLGELQSALDARPPRLGNLDEGNRRLGDLRRDLNEHADILHGVLDGSALTPYRLLGELVRHLNRGTPVPSYQLPGGIEWTEEQFAERLRTVRQFCARVAETGPLGEHPWRGAKLEALLPTDIPRIRPLIPDGTVPQALGTMPRTFDEAERWSELADLLRNAPPMDRAVLAVESRAALRELLDVGKEYESARKSIEGVFREKAWQWDPSDTRHDLDRFGHSIFRVFRSGYRRAKEQLASMAERPPKGVDDAVRALDTLARAQKLAARIPGQSGFGSVWKGVDSDWAQLDGILEWVDSVAEVVDPGVLVAEDFATAAEECAAVAKAARDLARAFEVLTAQVPFDLEEAFGVASVGAISIGELTMRAAQWAARAETLSQWVQARQHRERLREQGLEALLDQPAVDEAQFEYAYFEGWMREAMRRYPKLAMFDGRTHQGVVEEFRKLDQRRIESARLEVARKHYERLPKGEGEVGELGIVRKEIKKKRRHLPVRKLMEQAGSAIQRIKPLFMMSPLSVAQFLPPGRLEFDLLLIDEASQVEPVDAFGAISRTKQIVVVGDERQLPPTNFFGRAATDVDEDEEETAAVADIESILGVCSALGVRDRMLSWHYRSQHQSLIAVSNRLFYGNRLRVVPSPFASSPDLGLKFHYVEDGVFDRGGRSHNRVEALRVARAAIEHARRYPDESLGIGTFSVAQRDAILDELERLWRSEPDVRRFFAADKREPFFVKNLENVQGDERDAIFISVGYGRDSGGYFGMNFGPLQNDGGERRLNVLITRAKRRCEVFSSIRSGDIDLNRARSEGAAALREYLAYAESGMFSAGQPTGRGHDSPFEEEVARSLEASGYQVVPQVGIAGFYVDLSVVDPEQPGRYLIGIECDGASYHSSRSARDRDRIRQQVLEGRGWTIHRIWSTDWFNQRDAQLRKTLAAIEAAKQGSGPHEVAPAEPEPDPEPEVEFDEPAVAEPGAVVPYVVAEFSVPSEIAIHDLSMERMVAVVTKIVEIEGPVYGEVIARRVTKLWGLGRTGDRIQSKVSQSLEAALAQGLIREVGETVYDAVDREQVPIRDRSDAPSEVRKSEHLPETEIAAAVSHAIDLHVALAPDELARTVARMLGFKSTSSELASRVLRAPAPGDK